MARVNFTNPGPGRLLKSGEYATGGEFVAGQIVRRDAPASLIKSIMDKHVETMINEVGERKLATRSFVAKYRDQFFTMAELLHRRKVLIR